MDERLKLVKKREKRERERKRSISTCEIVKKNVVKFGAGPSFFFLTRNIECLLLKMIIQLIFQSYEFASIISGTKKAGENIFAKLKDDMLAILT